MRIFIELCSLSDEASTMPYRVVTRAAGPCLQVTTPRFHGRRFILPSGPVR
jgi:hypothetical protein